MDTFTAAGNHGDITVDLLTGIVLSSRASLLATGQDDEGYTSIARFEVAPGIKAGERVDILDLAYWTLDGKKEEAVSNWRAPELVAGSPYLNRPAQPKPSDDNVD